ncbi:ABC transporter permease [Spelaeicoccus albus]|uniref:Putative spermidine/putrescine transport system permease protein n=1 Tax=Spelaeicoccus albus TaxID=1280376 RepID=A0A7Z0CZW7_9MICO|nr:sugar ABC transporter permease [Spelaeicoccus albus]NYI66669.1 putative spermidine/putrescine transport system permease protein [Spelaeicoccus albus]
MSAPASTSRQSGAADRRPSLSHRLAERGIDRTLWLMAPGLLFIIVLFVYPFTYGLNLSLHPQEGGTFAAYKAFFTDPSMRGWESLWITLKLSLPAALINVIVSIPLAYKMRGNFRGKRTLTTLLVVPITLGTVLTAEGLLNFFGPRGWFNRFLDLFGIGPLQLVQNYWGVLWSLIISGFPFAFLLIMSYLSGIDPTLESAAKTLGADWKQRFRRVTLPLLAPGLATTFCLTFVLAFSVFPSAILVGDPSGSTRVIAYVAYNAWGQKFDYPLASASAIIMGIAEMIVIAVVLMLRSTMYKGSTGGKG